MPPLLKEGQPVHRNVALPGTPVLFGDITLPGRQIEQHAIVPATPRIEKRTTANGRRRRPDTPGVPSIDPVDKTLENRRAAIDVTGQDVALLGRGGLTDVPRSVKSIVEAVVPAKEAQSVVLQAAATYAERPAAEITHTTGELDRRRAQLPDAGKIFERTDPLVHRQDTLLGNAFTPHETDAAEDALRVQTAQAAAGVVIAERMGARQGELSPADVEEIRQAQEITAAVTGLMIEEARLEERPKGKAASTEKLARTQEQPARPTSIFDADIREIGSEGVARRTKKLFAIPDATFVIKAS